LSFWLTFITAAGAASAVSAKSAAHTQLHPPLEKKIIDKYQFDALPAFSVYQQYYKQHFPDAD